jgi:dipeptidyl aminopeptidase/acylaminoacyl peptidase
MMLFRRVLIYLVVGIAAIILLQLLMTKLKQPIQETAHESETQLTSGPGGRILTNANVWSPDGEWIAYDTRSDPAGDIFDGTRIEMVNVLTKEVRVLYVASNGANCGVVTWHPTQPKVAFILGPEHPTPNWTYGPDRRQGVVVDVRKPGMAVNLDARDLTPPFTPGALRGGSHVHVWNPDGERVSFTYEDHILATLPSIGKAGNQRNIGVALTVRSVLVPKTHPRNHDGEMFSVLVTQTTSKPRTGSDDLTRAFEEGWVGTEGYEKPDGTRQRYALAFQGHVRTADDKTISEVFIVDLPDDLTKTGARPLEGTTTTAPAPPRGTTQRRLTYTESDRHPGLQGPRHWIRSSPDGSRIGFLKKDSAGVVQFWTISPNGGQAVQVTHNAYSVASAFTWHPDGQRVAFVMDNSVCMTDIRTGETSRLTMRTDDDIAPRPEACVISPDGSRITFVRRLPTEAGFANQICVVDIGRPTHP